MGEIEDQAAIEGTTAAGSRGYLKKCIAFLPLLYARIRSLRRKQVLVLFATLVVLLVVLQTELNSFLRGFHSVLPSDGHAEVFDQDKTGASEGETGPPLEKLSLNNKNSDPVASGGRNNDVSKGQEGGDPVRRTETVSADRNADDSDAGSKAKEASTGMKREKKNTAGSDADREKDGISSKLKEKNTAETPKLSNTSESLSAQNDNHERHINDSESIIDNLYTGNHVKDVGYARTKCFSTSGQPRNHTCAPAVVIAGYEKCGTSALYYKLTKHPVIVAHPKWKENCPTEDSLEAMWSWFENTGTPILEDSTADGLLLNGCIGIVSKPEILRELQRLNPNLKVLAAFRNYADWAYSFYGYRCYSGFDEGCEKLEGPTRPGKWKKTRNPDNFAKLVKETVEAGKSPYQAFGVIEPNVNLFRQWLEELVEIVGRDAVKIVKQEDLAFSPRETLGVVGEFLGIDASLFDDEAYALVSNTNDHPAQISSIATNSTKDTISAVINSGSAIDQGTREKLNSFWKSECEWLRDNFDVHFSEVC